ncbi:hypothetical protein TrCOL_g7814, partial [Triparma columacea]
MGFSFKPTAISIVTISVLISSKCLWRSQLSCTLPSALPHLAPIWIKAVGNKGSGAFPILNFPWSESFRGRWEDISAEYGRKRECLVTNNKIIPGERTINLNDNWLQLQVRHAGEDTKCMAAFPILSSAIKEAEGRGVDIIGAGFSLLRAHTDIPIHQGDQNGLLRYHLGLNVPKGAEEKAALLLWSPGRYPRDSPPQK